VVGYLRPVKQWNDGKQAEYAMRHTYQPDSVEPASKATAAISARVADTETPSAVQTNTDTGAALDKPDHPASAAQ
jgi:ribonucleoside-triphosphate reductase